MPFYLILILVIIVIGGAYGYFRRYRVRLRSLEAELQASLAAKRELEDICRRNEVIINNTNSGLAYITPDYIVQWENISTCSAKMSYEAYKKGELCYQSSYGRSTPCEDCLLQRVMESKQMEHKNFSLPDGSSIEVLGNPVQETNGKIKGIVIRVDDVTEHQNMIRDLKIAKEKAEESDRLKTSFLANMSHEIRTPLNAITGFSNLLIRAERSEERKHFAGIIANNNDLLLRLINDALDLSKIESGVVNFHMQEVKINVLFQEIAASFRDKINEGVELVCEIPHADCIVTLDPQRLKQIIINFVTNAIKFTSSGRIVIGYKVVNRGVKCYVSDTGTGIAKEDQDKIFNRFEKLDKFAQGTGLGLSINKAIVDAYNGKIGVESEKGKGSLFWAWIPCYVSVENDNSLKL